jgi:predicted transposase/invertase (TIGR01784 family)
MTNLSPIYEKWRQETLTEGRQVGRQEGWQEGKQEERQSIALKMLSAGATVEFVAQMTEYSIVEIRQLQVSILT